jgi:hypothetical protein
LVAHTNNSTDPFKISFRDNASSKDEGRRLLFGEMVALPPTLPFYFPFVFNFYFKIITFTSVQPEGNQLETSF